MARPVILGNGALTVGLDELGMVHDFYYPYVGLDNLTNARSVHHKIGVWIDGVFSWVDSGEWQADVNFEDSALISTITLSHPNLGLELHFKDFVDPKINVFCRNIEVKNLHDRVRTIRLFMHQVFQISRAGRSDTALFVPEENYILDYKGNCSLLVYGRETNNDVFDQFAIGNYGIEGKEGTYMDAEDGELSGSAVEHGGVDSVVRFSLDIPAHDSKKVDYWIVAADSQFDAEKLHRIIKNDGLDERMSQTRTHWHNWLSPSLKGVEHMSPAYRVLAVKSLLVIKAHIDKRGGIIASCDSSIYNYGRDYYSYVWPRDGAYAIWPLIRLGYKDEPRAFFNFCRDIITNEGYLMHKYQPDKSIGSTWHPMLHGRHSELAIQEDESAIIIFMLAQYMFISGDVSYVETSYKTLIQPIANFLSDFIDDDTNLPHASYDLWEMKFGTSTYTTAVTYRALREAARLAEQFGFPDDIVTWNEAADRIEKSTTALVNPETSALRQGMLLDPENGLSFDNTLDISALYGVHTFGLPLADEATFQITLDTMERELLDTTPSGGMLRFENDGYFLAHNEYKGNPWIITTLWYAQLCIHLGEIDRAENYLKWVQEKALHSGVLSEQIDPATGGILSVTPLVWSHAEFINTVLDLAQLGKTPSAEEV